MKKRSEYDTSDRAFMLGYNKAMDEHFCVKRDALYAFDDLVSQISLYHGNDPESFFESKRLKLIRDALVLEEY